MWLAAVPLYALVRLLYSGERDRDRLCLPSRSLQKNAGRPRRRGGMLAENIIDLKQAELMIDWCADVLDSGDLN